MPLNSVSAPGVVLVPKNSGSAETRASGSIRLLASRAFISDPNSSSSRCRAQYSGLMPSRSRTSRRRCRLLSQMANANMPRKYCMHSSPHSSYEEWGDECMQYFRGMFAFAIWDSRRQRLLLVRDRLGIKPLYWARQRELLLFGSEIKALLASNLIEPEARVSALPEFFGTRTTPGAETLFKGIHKLEPGHRLVFERGQIRVSQYWDVPTGRTPKVANTREVVDRF